MVDDTHHSTYSIRHKLILKKSRPSEKEEVRCTGCDKLLYKVLYKSGGSIIELKCRKCGEINRNF